MADILDRVRCKALHSKIVSAEEAAAFFQPNMNVACSGFTSSGYPKSTPLALAARMEKNPFKVNIWTGASTGPEFDSALAKVNGIGHRMPFQTSRELRDRINHGDVDFIDIHLSEMAQQARSDFFGREDVALIEASAITEEGNIIPTTSVGNAASYVQHAKTVIVEINTAVPAEIEGLHDVYVPLDPPNRLPIPIIRPGDRIGTSFIPCTPDKIQFIVPSDNADTTRELRAPDALSQRMSELTLSFFRAEIAAGRMPEHLLPLQCGVGNVANAVIAGFNEADVSHLTVYTEVIQDGMLDLIDSGRLQIASGTAFSPSPDGLQRFFKDIAKYKKHIVLRPAEIANAAEVIRRLGVIAMNTAIEADIYGSVNSTHIRGTHMMNGIGGSGDFARNASLSIFYTPSTRQDGRISCIVPFASHVDHPAQDVDILITEQGVADLRGKSPRERARTIIERCAHPDFRPMLMDYFERADEATHHAQTPHILSEAFAMHERYEKTGTMQLDTPQPAEPSEPEKE